jgi:DNA polymerase III sliding clamp (beta) subunit (PCNA family)
MEFVPDGLKLTCDHPDHGSASETLAAELNPTGTFAIGVNAQYLTDAIAQIDDERVTMAFSADDSPYKHAEGTVAMLSPIVVLGTKDATLRGIKGAVLVGVVMPMRI